MKLPWHLYLAFKQLFPTGRWVSFFSVLAIVGVALGVNVMIVVVAFMKGFQSQFRDDVLDTVRRSIQRATALTASDLKKGVTALATIGSTAPFVGVLGTVIGVINAFVGIGSTGTGSIGAVSAGIAEALVETALGLFVAIPAVWFYNYLQGRLEYFNVEMDNSSSELVDYFIKKTAA